MRMTVTHLLRALMRVHPDSVIEIEAPPGYIGPAPFVSGLSESGRTVSLQVEVPAGHYSAPAAAEEIAPPVGMPNLEGAHGSQDGFKEAAAQDSGTAAADNLQDAADTERAREDDEARAIADRESGAS